MDVRQLTRPGIAASAVVHLAGLALILLFSEVHPFGTVTAEPIAVDLVTPEEAPKPPEPEQKPELQFPQLDAAAMTQPAASPPPTEAAQPPQSQAAPESHETAAQLQAAPQQPTAAVSATSASPTYTPPEPDLTVKYHVMLGLPDAPPPPTSTPDRSGDGIDANASSAANVSASVVAAFRQHLKSCSKLPVSVARSDHVMVKLRVMMTPQARLAAEPILIEGTASLKGVDLKQSAVRALLACQPYDMLPPDRYGEWKVLDLSFTPQDFV
ncbi:hypothetical protein [Bradyrhizobium sp. ARR65]|uniref:hypothetical protein n=1 Tax=Bradyrhizobium sp. ARR65 TaxID=1040989 RepID=UPI0004645F46|nr:hypothetical protein [Bradyrhizobium sp. ARR65]